MKRATKLGFAALILSVVVIGIWKGVSHRNRRQDIANARKLAGYEEDVAGRIILTPHVGGLALAYDPNLHGPTIGFRACMGRISACLDTTKHLDSCVVSVRRCISAIPWKNDPAGGDCCPEPCVQEYLELRKIFSEAVSGSKLVRRTCYPGMKEMLSGKKAMKLRTLSTRIAPSWSRTSQSSSEGKQP